MFMSNNPKKYTINLGKDRGKLFEPNKREIQDDDVEILDKFDFYDYTLNSTIGNLKEYFLTTFSDKYIYCKCQLSVYYKVNNIYHILSNNDYDKLNYTIYDELYLIKVKAECDCELKKYKDFMSISKFALITKLKLLEENNESNLQTKIELEEYKKKYEELNKKNLLLQKEVEKLGKLDEIKNHGTAKFEDFYDIVIDINSIKNVNTDGWKVKFNENGLNKYKKYKEQELITIGVLGNNNKGKSFILSRISKIKLLTGTSIQTEGLSIKYPELKGYKRRQIILLDSAGLETPVFKTENIFKEIKDDKEKEEPEKNLEEKEDEKNNDKNADLNDKEKKQNEEFKENARDKIMTELFLENFIIRNTDILLIVVGKLTYSEQLLINKIKVESKKQNKGRIFIIHNLQEFRTKDQVENYIKNTLLKCSTFDLNKRTWITIEKDKEENKNKKPKKEEIDGDKKEDQKFEDDKKEEQEQKENEQNEEKKEKINNSNDNHINLISQTNDLEISVNNIPSDNNRINPEQKDKNEIIEKSNILIESNQKIDKENEKKNLEDAKEKENIEDENVEEESKLNNVHFTEILNYGDKKLEIYHLIIANEDSEAGLIYNQYAFNFIANVYNLISEPKKFDVFDQVKDNFKNLSRIILNNNDIKEFKFNDNETIFKGDVKYIKLEYNKELNLKKCYTDELGFSLFKTGNFEPKYNYFNLNYN